MLDKVIRMRSLIVLWVVVAMGCTKPNPRSCADGTCSDSAFPFCDVDGALEGQPDVCVAVDCTPDEVVACRGDHAITCNRTGKDYDLVECPLGCDDATGGCKRCSNSGDCSNPTPYCEPATNSCRGCRLDAECDSAVCDPDMGTCVSSDVIAYATDTGSDSAPCTQAAPCSFTHAVASVASGQRSIARLLPGQYSTAPIISSGSVDIVATGAVLLGDPNTARNLGVEGTANVSVRGATFVLVRGSLICAGTNSVPTLHLRDVTVNPADGALPIILLKCSATVTKLDYRQQGGILQIGDDTTVSIDRLKLSGGGGAVLSARGQRMTVRITNSVFDDAVLDLDPRDAAAGFTQISVSFSTFVNGTGLAAIVAETNGFMQAVIENNIAVTSSGSAIQCAMCATRHNIAFPQTITLPSTNIIADPAFLDAAAHDFHLKAASPGVNAAVVSTGLATDHDFAGTARPQGPQPDIGAFELVP